VNLKTQVIIQTDISQERMFLDDLTFETSVAINSITDDEIRADIVLAIKEIPFLYNLTKKTRKKASDLKRYDRPNSPRKRKEDPNGRIWVDVVDPHILEDMDFFRERAIFFKENDRYCDLIPNRQKNSRYMRFWKEEQRRCREGYVRKKDGEWVTGTHYWYMNYCPILLTEDIEELDDEAIDALNAGADAFAESDDPENMVYEGLNVEAFGMDTVAAERVEDFPRCWDGDYLWYHYLGQARGIGKHGSNIKTRGRGYSFKGGGELTNNYYHYKNSKSYAIASEGDYLVGDGILNKAWDVMNFIDNHTPWKKSRDYADRQMHKKASYKDVRTKTEKGIKTEIIGVSTKGQPERARGKRGRTVLFEESGKFPHFKKTLSIARPSVEQGRNVFGMIVAWGTGGTEGADFEGIKEVFFKPDAWNMYGIQNVFDRNAPLNARCGFYHGEYLNREGCMDENGNSNVIQALLEIFSMRRVIARSTDDPNALVQEKADRSITPNEACMRREGHIFNVEDMKIHLGEVETNPKKYTDASWKTRLTMSDGKVVCNSPESMPIRIFPIIETRNIKGCVELFEPPINGHISPHTYIAGCDPYDDDVSSGPSLGSIFIMNYFTSRIVAEYTGRPSTAEEFYEICYRLMKHYNAYCNYENNKKGMFQYFDRINSTYMLCDTPKILRDMQMTKIAARGNAAKGTNTTKGVNGWRNSLIRSYLLEQAYGREDGTRNYQTIVSPALLQELIAYDPEVGNYDRISALGMLLIFRADLEKRNLISDDHTTTDKVPISRFILNARPQMGERFVARGHDKEHVSAIDRFMSKRKTR